MTAAVFFGCAFIAFGPAFSLFIFTIAKDPLRVIILIAGAFFWLVSLLLSSLVKANEGLAAISEEDGPPLSVREMAYVSGLGFGIMSGAFSMINTLSDSLGPGTVGLFGDSQYYFITSALMTLALTLLHTFWGVVFFEGCERKRCVPPVYAIMLLMAVWAFFSSGRKSNTETSS
ncbi:unnamed protein product [Coregonus sp. 'balchen']|nr:unnamed protein product [Coregonus sp. 'balchen']